MIRFNVIDQNRRPPQPLTPKKIDIIKSTENIPLKEESKNTSQELERVKRKLK